MCDEDGTERGRKWSEYFRKKTYELSCCCSMSRGTDLDTGGKPNIDISKHFRSSVGPHRALHNDFCNSEPNEKTPVLCCMWQIMHLTVADGRGDRHADESHRSPRCAANQTWLPDCRVPCVVCGVSSLSIAIVCAASCVMRDAWCVACVVAWCVLHPSQIYCESCKPCQ